MGCVPAPDKLRQYPWAATIGNHDVGGKAYEQHLTTPNTDRSGALYANGQPTSNTSGGDYWYIYKDVLFIDLNSNSYATSQGGGGDAAHLAYVTDIINQHGNEAKYKVLVYHHSIYSPAAHAKDSDNKVRRVDFPTTFSKLGVDLVLQGHDHSYTRSYLIKNGAKADADEQPGAANVYPGPGGVLYVTSNTASGSKYYDITAPDNSGTSGAGNGADPLNPNSYWYNSVQDQEHVRTYVRVQVRKDKLVVENVRSGTCAAPNAAVEGGLSCTNTPEASRSARSSTRSPCTRTTARVRTCRSTSRARLRASSAGRSTDRTAWLTWAPRRRRTTTSAPPARSTDHRDRLASFARTVVDLGLGRGLQGC